MKALVEVQNLKKYFPWGRGLWGKSKREVRAVDDVSFIVNEGETVGLVGESGCGKTTIGRMLLRLYEPTAGDIQFERQSILNLNGQQLKVWRKNAQMIFQDPSDALNPRMRARRLLLEPMKIHHLHQKVDVDLYLEDILDTVGLRKDALEKFPHEFSGGQRQRLGIARALAVDPKFIVADEPVSALDVSIQAQIVNLLIQLQEQKNLSYLFVSHDLRIVEFIAHRVIVMYLGKIMEILPKGELSKRAQHPYTKALLSAVPVADPNRKRSRIFLEGDVPSPLNPPSGCVFHPRCAIAEERCKKEIPRLRILAEGYQAACHLL